MKRQAEIMKNKPEKRGITLVEMLMAIVILLILIALTVTIGRRVEQQAEEKLTIEIINLVDAALGEFEDFDYQYKHEDYRALKFPIDCNDFEVGEIESVMEEAFGGSSVITLQRYVSLSYLQLTDGPHSEEDSGCEVMCFWLNMVPASRAVLDEIDQSLVKNDCDDGSPMNIDIDGEKYPLLRIVDAWGTTLHYSYYYDDRYENQHPEEELREPDYFGDGDMRPFPVVTSAGLDKEFGTEDDITNR